ncbi:MAG TPA: hypothetical protein VMR34_04525 [Candidatus Saccharimonadales bacterium]|nr:hypothetical protein [Candidatus Saccharimonadales bacterium]
MIKNYLRRINRRYQLAPAAIIITVASLLTLGLDLGISSALTSTTTNSTSTSGSTTTTTLTATQQAQHLTNIISKGNQEITRRLTTLGTLSRKISSSTKISATDKTTLSAEVNTEITGLTSLKTQLDADTTLTAAGTDATSIFTEYRVYALVVPKVELTKTADDQQITEAKLSSLAQSLTIEINTEKTNGKDTTSVTATLTDMTTQIANAQAISSAMETKVLPLQPSDYDTDQTILSGDAAQLKMAHSENEAAYADAKSIVATLKTL